jgi:RNA polymerase sigma factor (sigma-70 family)
MNEDATLLRRYAEEKSEAAFAALVQRHVDLVYGAALRRTGGDAHLAADAAQQVFTTVAREARRLARHPALSAWLHTATRNAALNLMISENRRRERERQAGALETATADASSPPEWERMRPVIDAAIDELPEPDRVAVVMRFLERHPFVRIGAALRVSEDAARMRTERALEKLRAALARRGITSTAAALGALVSSQPLVSAPAGLAATLAAQSVAAAGAAAGAGLFALLMNAKILVASSVAAAAAFVGGLYVGAGQDGGVPPPPPEVPGHAEKIAALRQENQQLRAEVDRLQAARAAAQTASAPARASVTPPPVAVPAAEPLDPFERVDRDKRIMNNLRQLAAAADQFHLEHGRRPASIADLVGETKYVRRLVPVAGEDYAGVIFAAGQPMRVILPTGETISYDSRPNAAVPASAPPPAPRELTPAEARVAQLARQLEPAGKKAMEAYRAANGGRNPPRGEALIPYFATPQEGADFVEFLEAQRALGRGAGR